MGNRELGMGTDKQQRAIVQRLDPLPISHFPLPKKRMEMGHWEPVIRNSQFVITIWQQSTPGIPC